MQSDSGITTRVLNRDTGSEMAARMSTHITALPFSAQAAREARTEVARLLAGRCSRSLIETATLLTSELATNAVLHGAPPVRLRAALSDALLRVEICDGSNG